MKAFYTFGIIPKSQKSEKLSKIEKKYSIEELEYRDVVALTKVVDDKKYQKAITEKEDQKNISWITKQALMHHAVIDDVYHVSTIVPMRFAVIFKDRESAISALEKQYGRFHAALKRIKGAIEWGVSISIESEELFRNTIKASNKSIKQKYKALERQPEGLRWFNEKKIEKELDYLVENVRESILKNFLKKMRPHCKGVAVLSQNISQDKASKIALLVANEKSGSFSRLLAKEKGRLQKRGISIVITGPWPPYNFVN